MTQVEAGRIENKVLGKYSHGYALLMRLSSMLYHDTIKIIAKLNQQYLNDQTDNFMNEYLSIVNDKKMNAKIKAAKLIEIWAKMLINPFDFILSSRLDNKQELCDKLFGRAIDAYFCFYNLEYDFNELYERANDEVDTYETLQNHHKMYVNIMNDDVDYTDEQKKLRCFVMMTQLMSEVFKKIEKSIND